MADIKINGGKPLSGTITPSGNKNSVLPALCATILTDKTITLRNVPDLTDVNKIVSALKNLGSKIQWDKRKKTILINNKNLKLNGGKQNLPIEMRASLLLIAPILSRFQKFTIDTTIGGCTLGLREIDPHVNMLKKLGAHVKKCDSTLTLSLPEGYIGNNLWPDYASVTTTENTLMSAVLARGTTILNNAAAEPHVQDLCNLLNQMGADINGIGSSRLKIKGVKDLHGAEFKVASDHHEIATFLALGAITGGKVMVKNAEPEHFPLIINEFEKLGVKIKYKGNTAIVEANQTFEPKQPFTENFIPRIQAAPWPYFPADLLPLMISVALKTKGPTRFWNKVYEGGLFWVQELMKFGAKIEISDPHRIMILGPTELHSGGTIDCPYIIRATVALMMAAMAAPGTTVLKNIDTIYRAHPNFLENLRSLGAEIDEI